MANDLNDEVGYPLHEAALRFADPELVRAFEEADAALAALPKPKPPPSPSLFQGNKRLTKSFYDNHPNVMAYRQAHQQVERTHRALRTDLQNRLIDGELIASGFAEPGNLTDPRADIPADRWRRLRPNLRRSEALGVAGQKVVQVRVRPARLARDTDGNEDHVESVPKPAGRLEVAKWLRAEIKRRNSCGLLTGNLRHDAKDLHEAAKQQFPHDKVTKPKNIERSYREYYRKIFGLE